MKNERDVIIDLSKGIGIILVIFGHLVFYGSYMSKIVFSFHMALFYFLSGYVASKNKTKKRVVALILPYMEFSIISLIVSLVIPTFRKSLSIKDALRSIFFDAHPQTVHNGAIWFLVSLIWCVLLLEFFAKKWQSQKVLLGWGLLFLLASVVISFLNKGELISGKMNVLMLNTSFSGFFFFVVGYISKSNHLITRVKQLKTSYKIVLLMMSMFFVLASGYGNGMVNICECEFNNPCLFVLFGFCGIVSTISFAILFERFLVFCKINWFGQNTLPILCTHMLVLLAYAKILSILTNENKVIMRNITIFESIAGTIVTCLISVLVIVIYDFTLGKANSQIIKRLKKVE